MARNHDHPSFGLGLEWLVAAVPEALLIVGARGVIEHANVSAAHLFGYSLDDLVGAKIETLVPTRLRAEHVRARMDFDRAPYDRPMGSKLEITGVRRDGSEFPVDIELRPRRSPEGSMTIVVLREQGEAAPELKADGANRPSAATAEIRRLLSRSRPLLAEVEAFLAEVLKSTDAKCREGRLDDSGFGKIHKLDRMTHSNLAEILRFVDSGTGPDELGR